MPCVIWFIPLTPPRSWLCPHLIWTFHPMTNSSHQGEAMPKTTNRSTQLHTLLTQLNLGTMADVFANVALRAAKEGLSHEAYLYELARASDRAAHTTTDRSPGAGFGTTSGENLSHALTQPTLPKPAIAIGTPQKRILPGNSDEYYRDWQTGGWETPINSLPL